MNIREEYERMEDYEKEAYQTGLNYAYGDSDYGFGENSHDEDLKHIPDCKDKEKWLKAWHLGCAVGVGE